MANAIWWSTFWGPKFDKKEKGEFLGTKSKLGLLYILWKFDPKNKNLGYSNPFWSEWLSIWASRFERSSFCLWLHGTKYNDYWQDGRSVLGRIAQDSWMASEFSHRLIGVKSTHFWPVKTGKKPGFYRLITARSDSESFSRAWLFICIADDSLLFCSAHYASKFCRVLEFNSNKKRSKRNWLNISSIASRNPQYASN